MFDPIDYGGDDDEDEEVPLGEAAENACASRWNDRSSRADKDEDDERKMRGALSPGDAFVVAAVAVAAAVYVAAASGPGSMPALKGECQVYLLHRRRLVGGPTCTIIADQCPDITATIVDVNPVRIVACNSDKLPVHEPGLEDYVKACTSRVAAVATSSNTSSRSEQPPSGPILEANSREGLRFDILSNPESLAEATSVSLSSIPIPRALKACPPKSLKDAREDLVNVYRHWVHRKRIFTTGLWSRELSQLVTNACITQRISSINAMAAICEATDADVDEVAHACGLDKRIGPKFLKANVGFGGSCCQKDILKLVYRWQSTEGR
ncbi:unnamed protein product [Tilletia laevis]|nr:unnamed protein product [Tilletia caries]CAD6948142.1 unnamed protein product [Tilletia laevis]CAD7067789.1 unnamed protein product [Tilletia caries]